MFLSLALFVVATSRADLPPMLTGVDKIVIMGDSITHVGASPKGYVTLIDQTLKTAYPDHPIQIFNAGVSGQKAPDMHARFKADVLDRQPQIVTLSVGVNDVWHDFRTPSWSGRVPEGNSGRGIKLPVYISEVTAMVKEAQAAGIKMVLVSPTLVYEDLDCAENKRLSEYVRAERQIARETHCGFIDLNQVFRDTVARYQTYAGKRNLLLTVDGVHMNDQGNALMADQILKALGVPTPDNLSPH